MDAPTERLPALAEVLAWFEGDGTESTEPIGDDADTEFIPCVEADRPSLPKRPAVPWKPPPHELMERVLEGLKRKTWSTPSEGDTPDESNNDD